MLVDCISDLLWQGGKVYCIRHSLLKTNNTEPGIIRQEINEYRTKKANTLKAIFQLRQKTPVAALPYYSSLTLSTNPISVVYTVFAHQCDVPSCLRNAARRDLYSTFAVYDYSKRVTMMIYAQWKKGWFF
ncbi:conserved hypothetical protein [Trichinella spiralis]|uniref:hypothetical protein n=1 Tax=Trichinella spiralis TaxID=6334 RepID=UPI0001EFC327|nr:conserved hypothetical protein [Trichinella spiralis]